jgi:AraC family transcriptional regulator of adaptative response/methylated-DNA-[protein]-cysteine methyltransferase
MTEHFDMVANALHYLVEHQDDQPGLAELSAYLGLSEGHVQRTFQDHAGVSPKQFVKMLTRERAMERLRAGASVMEAAFDSGLSGPGRLHDLLIDTDALTPGEARRRGAGVQLRYGVGATPFGPAMIAWSDRGISFLGFTLELGESLAFSELQNQWPDAELKHAPDEAREQLQRIFADTRTTPLRIWLRGSPFQLQVWRALLAIPSGDHVSYGMIAKSLGKETASRAVGTAVGRNPVAWLIPCHRVITSTGELGGYRWGRGTKLAMIGLEAGQA